MLVGVNFVLIILGLILVVKSADYLIASSISLGKKIGLSEMIIGIVIIGFGTSLSELVVSIDAILKNLQAKHNFSKQRKGEMIQL